MTTSRATLTGVEAKIRWARAHLAELKQSISRVLAPDRQTFTLERDVQAGDYVLRVHGLPTVDPEWVLIAGDCLHNLRSSLDHLAWQLVLLDGGQPNRDTNFPVKQNAFNKAGQRAPARIKPHIRRADIRDLVEQMQPYSAPQLPNPGPFVMEHPLWLLHDLDITDKHKLLLVIVAMPQVSTLGWAAHPDLLSLDLPWVELQEGAPVARFQFRGNEAPSDYNPKPPIQIMLNEPAAIGWTLTDFLETLVLYVEREVLGVPPFPIGFRRLF
ncbi:MAG: hypothetical protein LC808_00475 [Actinobacteria bacterium]|nr:hypothetical protein [Actinomycetota bacterium]